MKRSTVRCVGATLAGCLGAIVAAFAVAQQAPAPSDPIELFTKLMPVFGHPRCTNCHGGMNPHQERGTGFPIEILRPCDGSTCSELSNATCIE